MVVKIGNKTIPDAVEVLDKRYGSDNPEEWNRLLREEEIKGQIAQIVYDLRNEAKLSQTRLAKLVKTSQSVISRVENADYEGSALEILLRVCLALNRPLHVTKQDNDPSVQVA